MPDIVDILRRARRERKERKPPALPEPVGAEVVPAPEAEKPTEQERVRSLILAVPYERRGYWEKRIARADTPEERRAQITRLQREAERKGFLRTTAELLHPVRAASLAARALGAVTRAPALVVRGGVGRDVLDVVGKATELAAMKIPASPFLWASVLESIGSVISPEAVMPEAQREFAESPVWGRVRGPLMLGAFRYGGNIAKGIALRLGASPKVAAEIGTKVVPLLATGSAGRAFKATLNAQIDAGVDPAEATKLAAKEGIKEAIGFFLGSKAMELAGRLEARPAEVAVEPRPPEVIPPEPGLRRPRLAGELAREATRLRRITAPPVEPIRYRPVPKEFVPAAPQLQRLAARRVERRGEELIAAERERVTKRRSEAVMRAARQEAARRERVDVEAARRIAEETARVRERRALVIPAQVRPSALARPAGPRPPEPPIGRPSLAPLVPTREAIPTPLPTEPAPPTYAEAGQPFVPPGMPGGLPGQPPVRTPRKQLSAIHAARKRAKMPEDQFRALVSTATEGRTTSTKNLNVGEAGRVLQGLGAPAPLPVRPAERPRERLRKMAQAAPQEIQEQIRHRSPPPEEVARVERDVSDSIREVSIRHKARFAPLPGVTARPPLRTRIARSKAFQFLSPEQTSYETKAREAFGYTGKGYDLTVNRLRAAESDTQARINAAQEFFAKETGRLKVRIKDVDSWSRAVNRRARSRPVPLPSGAQVSRLKITPAEQARVVWMAKDPQLVETMMRAGISFRAAPQPVVLRSQDIRAITSHLLANHPRLAKMVDAAHTWTNTVGTDLMVKTYWQETGKPLDVRRGEYVPSARDIRALREERARAMSPAMQEEVAVEDMIREMARVGRVDARAWAKAERAAAAKLPRGERRARRKEISRELKGRVEAARIERVRARRQVPSLLRPTPRIEPELRRMPPLMPRIGGAAPLIVDDFFAVLTNHINRVASYSAKAIPVRDAQILLSDSRFLDAMQGAYRDGELRVRNMREALQDFKGLNVPTNVTAEKLTGRVLRRASLGILGLKPHIALYQPISYLNAMTTLPARDLFAPGVLAGNNKATLAEIKQYGPVLHARFSGSGHQIMTSALAPHARTATRMFWGGKRSFGEWLGLGLLHGADQKTIIRIWRAAKRGAQRAGFKGEALLRETNKLAGRAVADTQPTWDPLSISTIQRHARGRPMYKLAVMFTSQTNKNLNMAVRAVSEFRHSPMGAADAAKMLRGVLIPTLINATLVYGIGKAARRAYGYKREESLWDHLSGIADKSVGGWLVAGGALAQAKRQVEGALKGKSVLFMDPRHNPLTEATDDIYRIIHSITEAAVGAARKSDKTPEQLLKLALRSARLTAILTGAPIGGIEQIARPRLLPPRLPQQPRRRWPPRRR